jgi:hypothetical protein
MLCWFPWIGSNFFLKCILNYFLSEKMVDIFLRFFIILIAYIDFSVSSWYVPMFFKVFKKKHVHLSPNKHWSQWSMTYVPSTYSASWLLYLVYASPIFPFNFPCKLPSPTSKCKPHLSLQLPLQAAFAYKYMQAPPFLSLPLRCIRLSFHSFA